MEQNKTYKAELCLSLSDKPTCIQLHIFGELEWNEHPLTSNHRTNCNLCIIDIDRIEQIKEGDIVFDKTTLKTYKAEFVGDSPDYIFKVLYCSERSLCKNGTGEIKGTIVHDFISEYNKGNVLKYVNMTLFKNGELLVSDYFYSGDKIYTKDELKAKLKHLYDDVTDSSCINFTTLDEWMNRNL